jgi:hypothetical protein
MNKITEQYLLEYVSDVGEFEKEYRKYSSFYCTVTHTITQTDIEELKNDDVDASDFLGVRITRNVLIGDDNWGSDWNDTTYEKVEEYQELVPEVVIPEHYVTKYKTKAFKPVFEV